LQKREPPFRGVVNIPDHWSTSPEFATIVKQALTNTFENFKKGKLEDLFYQKLIDRMDLNDDTTNKLLNNKNLANAIIFEYLAKSIYENINVEK
jgi:histone deacetylase complex regulatory component SIN3